MRKLLLYISLFLFGFQASAQLVPPLYSIIGVPGLDADAEAFIIAASITDNTQKSAIRTLVGSLKANSLWTKFDAIWPFVGGTATAHAVNLKQPGTFNLTFVGSPTHSSTGVDWNGTTQYATTGYNPSTNLTLNNTHISYQTGENVVANEVDIGSVTGSSGAYNGLDMAIRYTTFGVISDHYLGNGNGELLITNTNSIGWWLSNRTASNSHIVYKDGVSFGSKSTSTSIGSLPNQDMFIGGYQVNGVLSNPTTKQCRFASVGDGFTSGEASTLYTIISTFQTALGR